MTGSDPLTEWKACDLLRQADLDHLVAADVPVLALAGDRFGGGFCIARDRIVPHAAARRFEFGRHDPVAGEGVSALIVLALGEDGDPVDLVAFHGGPAPFVGSWLGRAGLLGAENLWRARDILVVHADPLSWLRAGRDGVVVVDPVRAAPMLRDAGAMEVGTHTERRRLLDLMAVRPPPVRVRADERRAAA